MGTRSLTRVFDEDDNEIICMYRQFDGYPTGAGDDLAKFLNARGCVNGITGTELPYIRSNGIEDLAAQLVVHFKADNPVGGIYLYSPGAKDCGEDYVYEVRYLPEYDRYEQRYGKEQERIGFRMTCTDRDGTVLFEGLASNFDGAEVEAEQE